MVFAVRERGEKMWEQQLCRPQGQCRRRGRMCCRRRSRDCPVAHRADHAEAGSVPASHGGPCWSRSPSEAHGRDSSPKQEDARRRLWPCREPALEQAPGRTCRPVERGAYAGAGLLAGLVTPWGTHIGAACSWRTAPCGRDPCWGSSWRTAACGKDSHWSSSWRTVSHERDLTLEQGKSVRRKGQQRQHVMNWPQHPFLVPLRHSGEEGGESGSEVEPEKKGGVGGRCFKI